MLRWIEQGALRDTDPPTYRRTGIVLPVTILTTAGDVHPYRGVDLAPGALLDGVDLSQANLLGADLRQVSAVGTDLSGSILVIANLSGARLVDADLTAADLGFADLTDADLSGAIYDENTVFPSGNTFTSDPWGLPGGVSPWQAGMIPAPEPGFGGAIALGTLGVFGLKRFRSRRSSSRP